MNPTAFSIFGLDIQWYGVLITSGIILAVILCYFNSNYRSVIFDKLLDVVLIALPFGIIGARLYYVIFSFSQYKDNPIEIFNIRQGGLAVHGGLILALLAAWIYTRIKRYSFIEMADVAAPGIIIAQALGRWGNFLNQEAHGGPVSYEFISKFPAFIQKGMFINGTYYHPTFLYESLWNVAVFIFLMILIRKSYKKGIVFYSYIGLYSLGRFFIEGLRTDSLMIGPLRTAQFVSLIGIIASIALIIHSFRKTRING